MSFNGRQPAWHKSPGSARVCFPVSSDGPEEWRRCDERESVIYVLHHPPHQPPTEKWRVWPNWGAASDVMRVTRAWDACLDCGSSLKSQAVAFFYLALTWMNDNLWTSWGIFFYYLCLNRIFNSCSWILMWIFNNSFFLSKKSSQVIRKDWMKMLNWDTDLDSCSQKGLMASYTWFDVFGKTYKCHTASCSF